MSSREQILRNAGLPERLAPLVTGDTPEDMDSSARELADALGIRPAPSEAVLLARRALSHAEKVREIAALHGVTEPEAPATEMPPDFDGGAREPVPVKSDPEADHAQLMVELAARRSA